MSHVFVCVLVYTHCNCIYVHMCVEARKLPQITFLSSPISTLTVLLLTDLYLVGWLSWPTSEPQESTCLCLLNSKIKVCTITPCLYIVLGGGSGEEILLSYLA